MSRITPKFLPTHKENWTSGTAKVFTHNLNTKDVDVIVWDNDTDEKILGFDSIVTTTVNSVTITSSEAPTGSGWRVIIIGY